MGTIFQNFIFGKKYKTWSNLGFRMYKQINFSHENATNFIFCHNLHLTISSKLFVCRQVFFVSISVEFQNLTRAKNFYWKCLKVWWRLQNSQWSFETRIHFQLKLFARVRFWNLTEMLTQKLVVKPYDIGHPVMM